MTRYICSFLLSKDGQNDPPLRCRIKWDGSKKTVCFNLGYRINPERWDNKFQRCAVNSFHGPRRTPAAVINKEIQRYADACDAVFLRIAEQWPSVETVRSRMRMELGLDERTEKGVREALSDFIASESVRVSWSQTTVYKMRGLQNHLNKWKDKPDWSDFSDLGLSDFVESLRTEGMRNATIEKTIGFLKWFLRWAVAHHYTTNRDFETFRMKLKNPQKRVIYLEWDELMKLWNWDAGAHRPYLGFVRDFFCFCAFSGLRYSDAQNLRWADVDDHCFRVVTQKTADPLTIELNKWTEEILGRYVDVAVSGDYVFPRTPNQVINRALKEICRELHFDTLIRVTWYSGSERREEVHPKYELIGTHAARRTFICNALMMGIPPNVVMKWTGHHDYSAMRPYIDIAEKTKAQAMSLFDERE